MEERAIRDRLFDGNWESLLFVMLDEKSTPPKWLPKTHLRLNYAQYGDALAGAVRMRAQELGIVLKVETAIEKAKRVQASELIRAEREGWLAQRGNDAVRKEHDMLRQRLDERIAEIQAELTTIKLEQGADARNYVMRSEEASMSFYLHIEFPVTKTRIAVSGFDRSIILPGTRRMYVPGERPRQVWQEQFYFDYQASHGWCWIQKGSKKLLTTTDLAEYLIKRLFALHEDFRSGRIVRHQETEAFSGNRGWMG